MCEYILMAETFPGGPMEKVGDYNCDTADEALAYFGEYFPKGIVYVRVGGQDELASSPD